MRNATKQRVLHCHQQHLEILQLTLLVAKYTRVQVLLTVPIILSNVLVVPLAKMGSIRVQTARNV